MDKDRENLLWQARRQAFEQQKTEYHRRTEMDGRTRSTEYEAMRQRLMAKWDWDEHPSSRPAVNIATGRTTPDTPSATTPWPSTTSHPPTSYPHPSHAPGGPSSAYRSFAIRSPTPSPRTPTPTQAPTMPIRPTPNRASPIPSSPPTIPPGGRTHLRSGYRRTSARAQPYASSSSSASNVRPLLFRAKASASDLGNTSARANNPLLSQEELRRRERDEERRRLWAFEADAQRKAQAQAAEAEARRKEQERLAAAARREARMAIAAAEARRREEEAQRMRFAQEARQRQAEQERAAAEAEQARFQREANRARRKQAREETRAHDTREYQERLEQQRLAELERERRVLQDAFQTYEDRWKDLHEGHIPAGASLTFFDIPWPVLAIPSSPDGIDKRSIKAFLFSPAHSTEKARKLRLREAMLRFHPDRFEGRWIHRVRESDRSAVMDGIGRVVRVLNELSLRLTTA